VLGGLSPDANRKVPPLRPQLVHRLAADFPSLRFSLNGGLNALDELSPHLTPSSRLSGVMVGRAVMSRPWHWATVDTALYGEAADPAQSRRQLLHEYAACPPPLRRRPGCHRHHPHDRRCRLRLHAPATIPRRLPRHQPPSAPPLTGTRPSPSSKRPSCRSGCAACCSRRASTSSPASRWARSSARTVRRSAAHPAASQSRACPAPHAFGPHGGTVDRTMQGGDDALAFSEVLLGAAEATLLPETLDVPPGAVWNQNARCYDLPAATEPLCAAELS
jgi:hypothetical protein